MDWCFGLVEADLKDEGVNSVLHVGNIDGIGDVPVPTKEGTVWGSLKLHKNRNAVTFALDDDQ